MIEEKFYQSAINIRRTYLKLTSNMESYRNMAESTLKRLQKSLVDVQNLQKEMKEIRKSKYEIESKENTVNKIMSILADIELEGKRLENFVEPINKEIEKLAEEEQVLYKKICESHPGLSEDQIVDAVRERLKKENL
jgi:septal ring factor EnvC (AmiA/AmiB activator)